MIELEVYAAGIRDVDKILLLDRELEAVSSLRYKVDSNHDIVYLDFDEPTLTCRKSAPSSASSAWSRASWGRSPRT